MKIFAAIVAATAIGGATTSSMASTLNLQLDGWAAGPLSFKTSVTGNTGINAGAFSWSDGVGNSYVTFCTELTQNINFGNSYNYDIDSLSIAPVPNDSINAAFPHLIGGMGTYRAGLVQNLYDQYFSVALDSSVNAAAFQLAIWEIVYEEGLAEGDNSTLNVSDGDFTISNNNAGNQSQTQAITLANTWLSTLSSVGVTTLVALTNDTYQDQILLIPLPAPVLMAGLGLLAVPLIRRRVMRS